MDDGGLVMCENLQNDASASCDLLEVQPPVPSSPHPADFIPPLPSVTSIPDKIDESAVDVKSGKGVQHGCVSADTEILASAGDEKKRKRVEEDDEHCCKLPKIDYDVDDYNQGDDEYVERADQSVQKLEFDILDEIIVDESSTHQEEALVDGLLSDTDTDDDGYNEDQIDALLDESLRTNFGKPGQLRNEDSLDSEELQHDVRQKTVLKVRGRDHFEVLPEGWIQVTHHSGMPVYLHKKSRVCTFTRPYFLGPGSARKHKIPISAIPCLHYAREFQKEQEKNSQPTHTDADKQSASEPSTVDAAAVVTNGSSLSNVQIEDVQQVIEENSLDHMAVRDYCQKIFEFHEVTIRKFKTWASKRKHQKLVKQLQRPTLPSDTKLITCQVKPVHNPSDQNNTTSRSHLSTKEFVMNPTGKSYVCILHEYVQHSMRVQPQYKYKELENASMPYAAIVTIKDMEYGTGYGSSKKQAKSEAAKATLEILIPQMKNFSTDSSSHLLSTHSSSPLEQDLSFFDEIRVEDPRVHDLCTKAGFASPYQLLLECLKRNYGSGDTEINFQTKMLKHHKNEFIMTVGKHKASVICKNKRDGKQRASQSILQALHPHITCWSSLLRLYGQGSCKTIKEKKQEEQQITELQNKACVNKPNYSILNKLKEEMTKIKDQRDKVKSIGKFVSDEIDIPSVSSSDLMNIDL